MLFILTANEHILTEYWLQIVKVAITSVGMSVQDTALTIFIILPPSTIRQRGGDCGRDLCLKGRGGFSHPKRSKNCGLELEQAAVAAAAAVTENENKESKSYLTCRIFANNAKMRRIRGGAERRNT